MVRQPPHQQPLVRYRAFRRLMALTRGGRMQASIEVWTASGRAFRNLRRVRPDRDPAGFAWPRVTASWRRALWPGCAMNTV
jgi:hypothetical protein